MPKVIIYRVENLIYSVFCSTNCSQKTYQGDNFIGSFQKEDLPEMHLINDAHPEKLEKYCLRLISCDSCGDNIYDALSE